MCCPKVSIIIPVYNGSNYLDQAIQSALCQTYQNIEIIVVNDGSKDDGKTALIAQSYGEKIRYFEKDNGGSSSALNRGIREMTGEWFSWLSHDDLYKPSKVEREITYLYNAVSEENSRRNTIVFSGCELIDAKGTTIRKDTIDGLKRLHNEIRMIQGNEYLIAQPRKFNFHGCSCLIHRSVFENVGMFNEKLRYLNDVEMWFRIYAEGYKLLFVPEVLVKGRIHAQQVGRNLENHTFYTESNMLWERRINWLQHYVKDKKVFHMIGRDAYLSGWPKEGDHAFDVLLASEPGRQTELMVEKAVYKVHAKMRRFAKQLIIKLRT